MEPHQVRNNTFVDKSTKKYNILLQEVMEHLLLDMTPMLEETTLMPLLLIFRTKSTNLLPVMKLSLTKFTTELLESRPMWEQASLATS